jgi:hypothetical protein
VAPLAPTAKATAVTGDRIRERETCVPHRKPDRFLYTVAEFAHTKIYRCANGCPNSSWGVTPKPIWSCQNAVTEGLMKVLSTRERRVRNRVLTNVSGGHTKRDPAARKAYPVFVSWA